MTVKKARETIAKAFKDDADFRQGYVDNIACVLMDGLKGLRAKKSLRDDLASEIIRVIFET